MHNIATRAVALLLAAVLAACLPVTPSSAATVDSSANASTVVAASDDDDSTLDKSIMLGVFVVIVAVLVWVGFKTDLDRWSEADKPEQVVMEDAGPQVVIDLGGLPDDDSPASLTPEPEAELAGRVGLQFRF